MLACNVVLPLPPDHPCASCEVRRVSVFHALACHELTALRNLGTRMTVEAGHPLFHQGDAANRVYTFVAGSMRLYRLLPDGRRHVTGFILPGDFLGISREENHAFTAEAIEPSILWSFSRAVFEAYVDSHSTLKDSLFQAAAHELQVAHNQMVVLGRKTAMERLASFLLELNDRFERIDGAPLDQIALPMSRSDIADYLGLTKETVSRMLSQLRASRIVRLDTLNCVEVRDLQTLRNLAEGYLS